MVESNFDFPTLLQRLRAGDQTAYGDLIRHYGDVVHRAVRRKLHDRLRQQYDSLDFVQDVWTSVLALPPERFLFPTPEALAGFLTRVARNKVVEVFRQRFVAQKYDVRREMSLGDEAGEPEPRIADRRPSPSQLAVAEEQWSALMSQLSPGHRAVLERLREGYTQEEIAGMTGLSLSTVKRVVKRLKDLCGM